jgi:hypothetical protein
LLGLGDADAGGDAAAGVDYTSKVTIDAQRTTVDRDGANVPDGIRELGAVVRGGMHFDGVDSG